MDKRDCKINYKCPKAWDDLDKTEDPFVRHCDQCEKDVHFCADVESLKEATIEDLCVAVPTDDFEDGVMMGDIDWSGCEGDPIPPLQPEKNIEDADLLDNWISDNKPRRPEVPELKSENTDIDSWLNGEPEDPLSTDEIAK
ncbi:hypothetical protein ACMXYX_05810 [Neptuniibacter sp. QD72_48]|uniref:hypothetical protein n=1 Tax=unclassified Neptuniibacter TaxID=2630693 RepID=UPI0039F4EB61